MHAGVKVTCTGNQGHGSRFIEDTAAEKLVMSQSHIILISDHFLCLMVS